MAIEGRDRTSRGSKLLGVVALAALALTGHSCVFDTETTLCPDNDWRCSTFTSCSIGCESRVNCTVDDPPVTVCVPRDGCGDGTLNRESGELCDDGNIS